MMTPSEKDAIVAAGTMCIAAGKVIRSNAYTLSSTIEELEKAVMHYDKMIMKIMHEKEDGNGV